MARYSRIAPAKQANIQLPPNTPTGCCRSAAQSRCIQQQPSFHCPNHSTLRANSYPEVSNPFCRLPLPTFFHQLEAVHLGDLLRLWVRPDVRIAERARTTPQDFHGPSPAHRTPTMVCGRYTSREAASPLDAIPRSSAFARLLRKGDHSPRGRRRRLRVHLTLPF